MAEKKTVVDFASMVNAGDLDALNGVIKAWNPDEYPSYPTIEDLERDYGYLGIQTSERSRVGQMYDDLMIHIRGRKFWEDHGCRDVFKQRKYVVSEETRIFRLGEPKDRALVTLEGGLISTEQDLASIVIGRVPNFRYPRAKDRNGNMEYIHEGYFIYMEAGGRTKANLTLVRGSMVVSEERSIFYAAVSLPQKEREEGPFGRKIVLMVPQESVLY